MNARFDFYAQTPSGALGLKLGEYLWPVESVPRVGEIVTVHPGANLEPGIESRTGTVSAVQHVFTRGQLAVVTVLAGA